MRQTVNRYKIVVDVVIAQGNFSSVSDVLQYISYRLNLRGRDSYSIKMVDIQVVDSGEEQLEMGI